MAQYPAPPPLRLPDGTLVPLGMQGTQQSFAPTQGAMPYRQPKLDPVLDFAPTTPSRAAVAGARPGSSTPPKAPRLIWSVSRRILASRGVSRNSIMAPGLEKW